jgi:hypothetical protein
MEVRIKFSADVYIQGKTLDEIRDKWTSMNLWSDEAVENGVSFDDHLLIENAETYEDVEHEFWQCKDSE